MTYREWAEQYYTSAARVKEQLNALREEMKTAVGESLQQMERRKVVLYDMYRDCIYIANMLAVRKGEC